MEIRVKCRCGNGGCSEWAIVELQGVVESQVSSIGTRVEGLEIGNLCCSSSSPEIYTFTVGYHELSGTKIALKKPLLVLRKHKDDVENVKNPRAELEVVGIIRHRILFKNRPKALISRESSSLPF
ncbi:putative chromosome transmission fidelity protein [Dioscorea sansibarensis]